LEKMRKILLITCIIFLSASVQLKAETRHVPDEYNFIQLAINDCNDGDVVVVAPGTYFELINFLGKDITVTSIDPNDPYVVANTIIDGDGEGSVILFENGESNEAVFTGFTITGGYGTVMPEFGYEIIWGAGIFCYYSSPTIKRNVIRNNIGPNQQQGEFIAVSYGVGIACVESNSIITHNIIRNNSGYAGAGIMTYFGDVTISNNLIYNNSASIGGGFISLYGSKLINNTIANNDSIEIAGNMYAVSEPGFASCTIKNNIISNALSGGGIIYIDIDEDLITFNNICNNALGDYISVNQQTGNAIVDGSANLTGINGNISQDPLFVNTFAGDYHLQTGSPCITAGDPEFSISADETDIDGDPRVYAARIDIGADEFIGYVDPVASAGPDQHVAEPQLITLDGTGSFIYDPCTVLTYQWEQIAGEDVNLSDPGAAQPTFMPVSYGEYQFQLIVSENSYISAPDKVIIVVGNEPPVADAGSNLLFESPGRTYLDGTRSYDPDPIDKLTYTWTQLEGPEIILKNPDTATPYFDCTEDGIYVFELTVSDGIVNSEPSIVQLATAVTTMNQIYLDVMTNDTSGDFHYPDISGDVVVYSVGSSDNYSWDIVYRNIETDDDFVIEHGGLDTHPKIDGDIIVWTSGPTKPRSRGPECTSIFARNIYTNNSITLREFETTASYSHPVICANKVVWLEHLNINKTDSENWYNMPYNIAGADITNFNEPVYFNIAENVGTRDPYPINGYDIDFDDVIDISGDIVVYEANGDIFGADISDINDIRIFSICTDPALQSDPSISGNFVVWTDERNDDGDIYGADISDMENIHEMEIAIASGIQTQPDIDSYLVVYTDGDLEGGQIRVSCITRQFGAVNVPLYSTYGTGPAIDGGNIVWQTDVDGDADGFSVHFGYSFINGPVENLNTGEYYDYIQHAIVSASEGDHILVNEGIYQEKINFIGKNLTVSSKEPNNPAVVGSTIITNDGQIVTFSNEEDANSILCGFTISGGTRGIYCSHSSPEIENCDIQRNFSSGIHLCNESKPIIKNCRISANTGSGFDMRFRIEGRYKYFNYPDISNCIIAANGQYGLLGGNPVITNCTISDNSLGGIYNNAKNTTVTNSIIYYNGDGSPSTQIDHSQTMVTYSDIQGSWQGDGNIDLEPLFADYSIGDYHLKSEAGRWEPISQCWILDIESSPCIDTGDPGSDIGLETVPNGSIINMGAYGGTGEASKTPSEG